MALRALGADRLAPDEGRLALADQPAQAHLVGRVTLQVHADLARSVKVDVDQEQPGLDARDVQREHAGRLGVVRLADSDEPIPHVGGAIPRHPDLVARGRRCSRCAKSRRHIGDATARHPEVLHRVEVDVGDRLQQPRRRWPLHGQRRDLLGDVLDLRVQAGGVLAEPAQARVRGGPPPHLIVQPRDCAVVDDLATLVAPGRVDYLPDRDLRGVARDDAIHQARGVGPADDVLEQRRDVDQRGAVANRGVLVLVVRLVGADRVIPRPLAVVQALAERRACGNERRYPRAWGEYS